MCSNTSYFLQRFLHCIQFSFFQFCTALGSTEDLSHIVEAPKDIHLATKGERESAMILVGSAGQGDLAVVERVLDRYPYIVSVGVFFMSHTRS